MSENMYIIKVVCLYSKRSWLISRAAAGRAERHISANMSYRFVNWNAGAWQYRTLLSLIRFGFQETCVVVKWYRI